MKTTALFVALSLALAVGLRSGWAEDKNPRGEKTGETDEKVAQLMQEKLKRSQGVLEGLALGDFNKISDNASELAHISRQAEWLVFKTPRYELYSNEFRRDAEALIRDAKEKNLDAAALSYVELTLTCVRCHKYAREMRNGRLDLHPPTEPRAAWLEKASRKDGR
jgi:hypothetical protein